MNWKSQFAYTLGGISSQFPSNFGLFVIIPKQGYIGIHKTPWYFLRLTIPFPFKFGTIWRKLEPSRVMTSQA